MVGILRQALVNFAFPGAGQTQNQLVLVLGCCGDLRKSETSTSNSVKLAGASEVKRRQRLVNFAFGLG